MAQANDWDLVPHDDGKRHLVEVGSRAIPPRIAPCGTTAAPVPGVYANHDPCLPCALTLQVRHGLADVCRTIAILRTALAGIPNLVDFAFQRELRQQQQQLAEAMVDIADILAMAHEPAPRPPEAGR